MPKLYEISAAYQHVERMMDDPDIGEFDVLAAIDTVDGEMKAKAENIAMLVRNMESAAKSIKEAEETMAARRKSIERRADAIKYYVLRCMQAANVTQIECPYFSVAVQKNPPSVVIDNQDEIDMRYWRQKPAPDPEIDKKAILADIKQGIVVDGAHMEQSERLVIR